MEPGDAADAAEEHQTAFWTGKGTGGPVGELVRLQTIVDEITSGLTCLWRQTTQTVVGGNPEHSMLVLFDGGDAVVGQSFLSGIVLEFFLLQVVAVETVVGTDPELTVVLLRHACGGTVVETVLAEDARPVHL